MKTVEEIEQEISVTQEQLLLLLSNLEKQTRDVDRLAKVNAGLIENNLGEKPRKEGSVESQQRLLTEAREQILGYERVQANLESRLADLNEEKKLAALYAEVSGFSEQEDKFNRETNNVFAAIHAANTSLEKLHKLIHEYPQQPAEHLEMLKKLQSELKDLSFRDFLNGELIPCEPALNASFCADQAQAFYTLANGVPELTDVTKSWQELQDKLMLLSRLASSMVPRSYKFVETPKPIKATPIDKPPAEIAEINGKSFKWDEELQRYVPAQDPITPVAPPRGVSKESA